MSKQLAGGIAIWLGAFALQAAASAPPDLDMGRYLTKYPALYSTLTLSSQDGDEIFDAQGGKQATAAPTYGAGNAFGERRAQMQLEWHFPWFETEQLPFISSRLWTARARLGYAQLDTRGPIAAVPGGSGGQVETNNGGLTDIELEFGPVLVGSRDWRTRTDTPLSVILLGQALIPAGQRNSDAPHNVGLANAFGYGARLGAHWRPLRGFLIDAGAGWRGYTANEEPAFGAQEPAKRGDEFHYDLSLNLRLFNGLYAGASWWSLEGDANTYEKVRFASNPPTAGLGMETMPDPAPLQDGGTAMRTLGVSLRWFVTPRFSAALHVLQPRSGRSGEFELPYTQQATGCAATLSCNPQGNGSARVDGLGAARRDASRSLMLSLAWNYGQGDFWAAAQ